MDHLWIIYGSSMDLVGGLNPSEKNSQFKWLFPIYGKIKNGPNHQPDGENMGETSFHEVDHQTWYRFKIGDTQNLWFVLPIQTTRAPQWPIPKSAIPRQFSLKSLMATIRVLLLMQKNDENCRMELMEPVRKSYSWYFMVNPRWNHDEIMMKSWIKIPLLDASRILLPSSACIAAGAPLNAASVGGSLASRRKACQREALRLWQMSQCYWELASSTSGI